MSLFKSIFNFLPLVKQSLLIGQWKSTLPLEEIKTLSNFSNWMEQTPSSGHLKFLIEKKENGLVAKVGIPIKGDGLEGYYSLYQGKLKITNQQLIITQNESTPIKMSYTYKRNILTLNFFNQKIKMKKQF